MDNSTKSTTFESLKANGLLSSIFFDFEQSYLPAYQDSVFRKAIKERYVQMYLLRLLSQSGIWLFLKKPMYRFVLEYLFYRKVSSFFVLYGK